MADCGPVMAGGSRAWGIEKVLALQVGGGLV
jgi:hypothetical protein